MTKTARLLFVPLIFLSIFPASAQTAKPDALVCTPIKNANQLSAIRNVPNGSYCLVKDIDLGSIANFVPIANFAGALRGNNHVISNLTIDSADANVGLFAAVGGAALIEDLVLRNVKVSGTADNANVGGLAGALQTAGSSTSLRVSGVSVSGQVSCSGQDCVVGGLTGLLQGFMVQKSSSSATVTGASGASAFAGGLVGFVLIGTVQQSYATGAVSCACVAGGLAGKSLGEIKLSYASGPVIGGDNLPSGGLIGNAGNNIENSYAAGSVTGGAGSFVAALIGQLNDPGSITASYAIGKVSGGAGATLKGLVASTTGFPFSVLCYWDTQTTGQATSVMGSGLTTVQLRAALQSGFGNGGLWWITKTYSYPFLNDPDMTFASPLATLIMASKPFIFLPISQLDDAQYKTAPAHGDADGASLATVYTMIARAVGISDDVNKLKGVAIDRYFWRDGAQQVKFAGPVTTHATLLADKALGAKDKLDDTNVVGELKKNRLVILHGSYDKEGGGTGTHWLLGTLFALDAKSKTAAVVGNDPWIGQQVMIDPKTRTVTSPENFPLANFKVDGYQSVKILN